MSDPQMREFRVTDPTTGKTVTVLGYSEEQAIRSYVRHTHVEHSTSQGLLDAVSPRAPRSAPTHRPAHDFPWGFVVLMVIVGALMWGALLSVEHWPGVIDQAPAHPLTSSGVQLHKGKQVVGSVSAECYDSGEAVLTDEFNQVTVFQANDPFNPCRD